MDNFSLDDNLHQQTLFIVDEASMIANDGLSGAAFGTGRLLDDLIQYVYAGTGCRLMLIGDTAQLPPVGEEQSPALSPDVLKGYGLEVYEAQLTEVVRTIQVFCGMPRSYVVIFRKKCSLRFLPSVSMASRIFVLFRGMN